MAKDEVTTVYILARRGENGPISPVKIGITGNLAARINTINTSSPFEVCYFISLDCFTRSVAREVEATVHSELDYARLNGEWFKSTPYDAMAALCTCYRAVIESTAAPEDVDKTLEFAGVLHYERRCAIGEQPARVLQ